jgi:protein-S-isoprenylcysteine O-methyltransferase Ste14
MGEFRMAELLDALGIRRPRWRAVTAGAIWAGFAAAMGAVAAGQALAERALGLGTVATALWVATVWALWSVWHSLVFGWNRRRYLGRTGGGDDRDRPAYARAFVADIFPAITVGFSQMLRPAWNGENVRQGAVVPHLPDGFGALLASAAGVALCGGALLLFAAAWRTLGAGKVGFVGEFVAPERFEPVQRGPYAHVRHPLFWSGVAVSTGLALLVQTGPAVGVAVVNVLYGLVYNHLEDRRLQLVFGDRYGDYLRATPRILPVHLFRLVALRLVALRMVALRARAGLVRSGATEVAGVADVEVEEAGAS